MITVQQLRRAKGIEAYYASALSEGASEYYASQRGVWYGKGAARIQLPGEVSKEDLVALCNNEVQKTGGRLTARTNDTRHEPVIDKETGQPMIDPETGEVKMREMSNRRIAVDFTFSVPKSVSMHIAEALAWVKSDARFTRPDPDGRLLTTREVRDTEKKMILLAAEGQGKDEALNGGKERAIRHPLVQGPPGRVAFSSPPRKRRMKRETV